MYGFQAIEDQEQEAIKLCKLADSIVMECKQNRPIAALETAISLLRRVLDQRPPSHPLRSDILRHLSIALLSRFNQWGWTDDYFEAFKFMWEIINIHMNRDSNVFAETHVRRYLK